MGIKVKWNSKIHLQLTDIYMNSEDNISCYDGCKEMAYDHFENNYEDAIKTIQNERGNNENKRKIQTTQ